ncbi:MAG: hypothetical protein F8N36_15310 [Desulfovibrio sp.]|uniref:hypothetical protein n=1 Tax=Desulfovibrio sp. TaxID=885 RepID=UPI00135D2594|nr:hypothetical protein [Desulfovibrio sp.]MTJ94209.1 hypothetical protein [Desulfovibrio sp.]
MPAQKTLTQDASSKKRLIKKARLIGTFGVFLAIISTFADIQKVGMDNGHSIYRVSWIIIPNIAILLFCGIGVFLTFEPWCSRFRQWRKQHQNQSTR